MSKYAAVRQRFEQNKATKGIPKWPARMDELNATSAEYIIEECDKLFERCRGQLQPLYQQRLLKLLQRLHLRFGPDSQHNYFRKLLRRALRSLNFGAALIILKQYLNECNLNPVSDDSLDLLIQSCVWIKSHFNVQQRQIQRSRETLRHVLDLGAGFTYLSDLLSTSIMQRRMSFDHPPAPDHQNRINRPEAVDTIDVQQAQHVNQDEFEWQTDRLLPVKTSPDHTLTIKSLDDVEAQFEQLVHLLLPFSRPSHSYAGYGSLLELLIRSLPSIDLVPLAKHSRAERLLRICLTIVVQMPQLDANPVIASQRVPTIHIHSGDVSSNQSSLLQLSIDLCHYDIAAKLVESGARIAHINIHDVLFLQSTERLFQLLYMAGHQFVPADRFQSMYNDCIRQDKPFQRFCSWLRAVQSRQLPLMCLCWNAIRANYGSDAQFILDQLEQQIDLPPAFIAYAKFQALDILEQI